MSSRNPSSMVATFKYLDKIAIQPENWAKFWDSYPSYLPIIDIAVRSPLELFQIYFPCIQIYPWFIGKKILLLLANLAKLSVVVDSTQISRHRQNVHWWTPYEKTQVFISPIGWVGQQPQFGPYVNRLSTISTSHMHRGSDKGGGSCADGFGRYRAECIGCTTTKCKCMYFFSATKWRT